MVVTEESSGIPKGEDGQKKRTIYFESVLRNMASAGKFLQNTFKVRLFVNLDRTSKQIR